MKEGMVGATGNMCNEWGLCIQNSSEDYNLRRDVEGSLYADSVSWLPGRQVPNARAESLFWQKLTVPLPPHVLPWPQPILEYAASATHQTLTPSHTVRPDARVTDSCLLSGVCCNNVGFSLNSVRTHANAKACFYCSSAQSRVETYTAKYHENKTSAGSWMVMVHFQLQCHEPAGKGHVTKWEEVIYSIKTMQSCILEEGRLGVQTGPKAVWPRDRVIRSKPVRENVTELIMTDPTDLEPSALQARAREMT